MIADRLMERAQWLCQFPGFVHMLERLIRTMFLNSYHAVVLLVQGRTQTRLRYQKRMRDAAVSPIEEHRGGCRTREGTEMQVTLH